jgi:2-polyprenyl-3-methyl-5-hydroxy-6-metoxy-1,4-benzoquinol methylase
VAAQRALFRVIRPYSFQQRQFQDALIGALLDSLRRIEGQMDGLRGEASSRERQVEGRLAEISDRVTQQLAADSATQAALAALSQRVFVAPFDPGHERFLQRAPNGDTRLGYGLALGAGSGFGHGFGADLQWQSQSGRVSGHAVPLFRARQRLYLPLLKHRSRVLDIGCGRGAMLDLLRVARIPALGVDFDPAMVSHCRENGHTVEQADALQFLRTQPDASVAAIFSARFLEHLALEQLQEFLRLCRSRLEHGGLLIAETANPRAAAESGACSLSPLSPEVALALCQQAGFEQAQVVFPTGTGALDPDRHAQAQYTVLATAGTS